MIARSLRVMRMFGGLVGKVPAGHLWYLYRRMRNEKPHRFGGQTRVNTFFPPYPSRAFDRFCETVVNRKRVPLSTYLAVTHECPYSCGHCSVSGRRRDELSPEAMLDVVAQIKALGTCTLGLTGGEPLLRGDVEDLVAEAGPEMATIVFTTGRGLDETRARRLAEADVTCVTVGIESDDPAAHDAVRRSAGSFAEAAEAVQNCRAAGVYTAVSTVGTRERMASGELERMYAVATAWGVGEFRVLAPVATGRRAGCASFMLTGDEYRRLGDFHVTHNRRRGGPAVACFAYLESDEMFGCGAGYHHLFIDAAGNICPCDLTPLSFGNLSDQPLADIWQRMASHFPHPRRGCLMRTLTEHIDPAEPLPMPPNVSQALCPPPPAHAALPEGYRRLLTSRE